MRRIRGLIRMVTLLGLCLACVAIARADDAGAGRVVLLETDFTSDPWTAKGGADPKAPTWFEDVTGRGGLEARHITSYELEDLAGGKRQIVRWKDATSPRVIWTLAPNVTVPPIIAASHPKATLKCRILEAENCTVSIVMGTDAPDWKEPAEIEIETDFRYAKDIGRYDRVGKIDFEVKPVDEKQPYSGAVALLGYRIEGDADNARHVEKHQKIKKMPQGYHGEISVGHLAKEPVALAGVAGEPLCFSVKFDQPVDNALVTADIPCDDVRVRWMAKWKTFLVNDPSLCDTDADVDAPEMKTALAGGAESKTEKAWVSFVVPEDAKGQIDGTVTVTSNGNALNTIPVKVEVYPFTLPERPAVRVGIYVVQKKGRYREPWWDDIHQWMAKAGIEWSTNPIPVPSRYVPGRFQETLLERNFLNRRANGLPETQLFTMGVLGYEIWRFLWKAEDKYDLDKWIGASAAGKIKFTYDLLGKQGMDQLWVYSFDEAPRRKLIRMEPFYKLMLEHDAKVFAAIHARSWEIPHVRDSIGLWIMTERNCIFNEVARRAGKITAKYGYPFTDTEGFHVHREQFAKCLYSDVDFYFNYALNDINGHTFDKSRKMCLIVPTDRGLVEIASGDGFIRGAYDMRYVAALRALAEAAIEKNPNNAAATEALAYLDLLNPKVDYNAMKTELARRIIALSKSGGSHLKF